MSDGTPPVEDPVAQDTTVPPAAASVAGEEEIAAATRPLARIAPEPLVRRILGLVAASPGVNMSEVARALGVSKRAAQNHVLDLLTAGGLVHRREGTQRLLYPAETQPSDALIAATTPVKTA